MAKPRRLNVSNPRAAFMGAFVEAQPGRATQAASSRPPEPKQPGNQPELHFCLTSLTQKHNSSFVWGRKPQKY